MKAITEKYKKLILYIAIGAMTTGINIFVFAFCLNLKIELIPSNTIAFILAVLFAYVSNSKFVFRQGEVVSIGQWIIEGIKFFGARILTFFIDTSGIKILWLIGLTEMQGKVLMSFVILVLNYMISNWLIFKKSKDKEDVVLQDVS
jgi:putative flippase GtrA